MSLIMASKQTATALQGGYMHAKKKKLNDQFDEGCVESDIFHGVSIHVNGYTGKSCSSSVTKIIEKFVNLNEKKPKFVCI